MRNGESRRTTSPMRFRGGVVDVGTLLTVDEVADDYERVRVRDQWFDRVWLGRVSEEVR